MSVRAFSVNSGNNIYSDMYGGTYCTDGILGTRAYRNATVSNQNILAKTIARSHNSELKNAYKYLEDGNVSAFQSIIDEIASNEASKQRTYNVKDEEIRSAIEDAYEQVVGADYDSSLTATKQGSFESGFNQNLFFGIFSGDSKSAAEYSAERRGTKVNADEQNKKNLGAAAGIATTAGAAVGACALGKLGLFSAIGTACSVIPVWGWVLGLGVAAVGAVVALTRK